MKNIIIMLFAAFLLISCEKTVDLKYKDHQPTIIIEGNITNISGPYIVKITRSLSITATGEYPVINDATVTISDDAGNIETLSFQGNGIYSTTSIAGVEGRTYTLTVNVEDETYTAQSRMPETVAFDSVKVEEITTVGEKEYNLIPVYHDPLTTGNHYRFLVTVNNKLLNQHFILNDEIKNGMVNTLRLEINTDDLTLKAGDVIDVMMQCVDEKVALYYKTLALIGDSGPGGGTTPNNPPNNFSNGALGLFSAHTTAVKSITIP